MTTVLMGHDPEQMQAADMSGIELKDLPVEPFGLGQPPGLVVPKRITEHPLNGRKRTVFFGAPHLLRRAALIAVHTFLAHVLQPARADIPRVIGSPNR